MADAKDHDHQYGEARSNMVAVRHTGRSTRVVVCRTAPEVAAFVPALLP